MRTLAVRLQYTSAIKKVEEKRSLWVQFCFVHVKWGATLLGRGRCPLMKHRSGWSPTETSCWLPSVADSSWTLGARTYTLQGLGKSHLSPCLRQKTGSNYKTKRFTHFSESVFRDIWNSSNEHTKESIRYQQLLTNYMYWSLNSSSSTSCRVHTVKLSCKEFA